MVEEKLEKTTTPNETSKLLKILEEIGRETMAEEFKISLLDPLPKDFLANKEYLVRFLLLAAILDQQAESPTARDSAIFTLKIFGIDLFENPLKVIYEFNKLQPLIEIYKISPAIGRATPRFGWLILRVGGFLIFELQLNYRKKLLYKELFNLTSPLAAYQYLQDLLIVKNLLREKACRLYISWIGHPDLYVNISNGRWKKSEFLMPVDGHVGKIFARTGMLDVIQRESSRKDIISLKNERANPKNSLSI